jgi:D-aminopeptidase
MATPTPSAPRARARDLGVVIGTKPPGPTNGIVDVPGVRVGHVTVWHDEPSVARTGVTVIVPDALAALYDFPIAAGTAVLNGAGELTNSVTIAEWGLIETPIVLTNTMAVGRAYDGVVQAMLAAHPGVGREDVIIPTVGECDDSFLNDARALSVTAQDTLDALAAATTDAVVEGSVGAGTGMTCLGYKGGIGTASRVVLDGRFTIGVLALTNFGADEQLVVDGVPIGRLLPVPDVNPGQTVRDTPGDGSCYVVIATDAPLSHAQCERVARRAGLGLARTGSIAHHWSGEIFCAFSTTHRGPRLDTEAVVARTEVAANRLNEMFGATVEATEEAVLNSLFVADTVVGVDGHRALGLPHDTVLDLLRSHGRLP